MGIDIKNKNIIYNASHNNLLGTSVENKLTKTRLKKVSIYSIFRRVKNRDKEQKGDANPAIFALKRMRGFSITDSEKKKFFPNFFKILKKILLGKRIDLIIVMPYSHPIAKILALRVSKILGGVKVENNFLKKSKNSDIVNISLSDVKDKDKHEVSRILLNIKKMPKDKEFSMKGIDNRYRKYFKPLQYGDVCSICDFKNILIIDDLYSTGSTMGNAIELIGNLNEKALIEGLCLFSPLAK